MATTVRRATETNHRYRFVEEDDLVAGLEVLYIDDTKIDPSVSPTVFGSTIKLDDDPVRDNGRGSFVYYHFVRPAHDMQCFVPLEDFLEQFVRHDRDYKPHYWLPL